MNINQRAEQQREQEFNILMILQEQCDDMVALRDTIPTPGMREALDKNIKQVTASIQRIVDKLSQ